MERIETHKLPIRAHEAVLRVNVGWLHFTDPHRIIQAQAPGEVLPALRAMEGLVTAHGWHAAGFVSYEAAAAFDQALRPPEKASGLRGQRDEGLLEDQAPDTGLPLLWFGLYPPPRLMDLPQPVSAKPALTWLPSVDRDTYNAAIARIKEYIAAGRTYQVNYTMRLRGKFHADPWEFFLHLAQNQNNHAAYVDTGRYVIASASPELFFELDGETLTSRPMKGTAPRGRTTQEDREQAEWLQDSEKNRAENVMIVDMVRNDMGRIARVGSVHVPELFTVEKYPTLWQMTSTVQAATSASLAQIFTALFPCASITGAPKVSTMRIISELETTPRRIYTGSVGYIAPQRKASFNVAIRTALIDRETQTAEYGVGGGIVWDSTSLDEYAEALLKARVLTESAPSFALLETLLWMPEEGFFLREKHITRLLDSAEYFDFPVSPGPRWSSSPERHLHLAQMQVSVAQSKDVSRPPLPGEILNSYLDEIASQFTSPQRVRLLLNKNGELTCEAKSFQPPATPQPLRARLARGPIHSGNIFLSHKTTHRDVYDSARRDFPDCDDVLLYNERGELTEFTLGNLVVELDGRLFTPPVACGLLPGTFREHLQETGQVTERVIRVDELKDCTRIFFVNSVRKWQGVLLESK